MLSRWEQFWCWAVALAVLAFIAWDIHETDRWDKADPEEAKCRHMVTSTGVTTVPGANGTLTVVPITTTSVQIDDACVQRVHDLGLK